MMYMQTEQQKRAFEIARQAGVVRELALMNGGTGEECRPLSHKEYATRKNRNKAAKQSRKANR